MARSCTVCNHPDRDGIDRALLAGESAAAIAAKYREISDDAVNRHRRHVPATLVKAQEAQEVARADDLLCQLQDLHGRTLAILSQAEAAGKLETALKAIREARGNLELLAELVGELDRKPQINLMVAPEWINLRAIILQVLEPYPEARLALADRLKEVNGAGH